MQNLQMSVRLKDGGREIYFRDVRSVTFDGVFLEVTTSDSDRVSQKTRIHVEVVESYGWHFRG